MMAAVSGSGCVTVILLSCVLGSQALDLLRITGAPGSREPPSTPTVQCWCANYPNETFCAWSEPSVPPSTHYVATYRERHRENSTEHCLLIPPHSPSSPQISASFSTSEQIWLCHLPNLKLFTDYIINITAVHSGSSSYMTSFMLEDIVKPDPPVDVRVSPQNGNILVQWSPPLTWKNLDIFPLQYYIVYQWENKGTPKSVSLGPSENTSVELKGLCPGRTYLFQVCAQDLLGLGECSDWSSPVNITMSKTKP
ncbi:interleukin-27 subunit beta [Pholidichthys leucotaenia]